MVFMNSGESIYMTHLKISFVCIGILALVWGNWAWADDLGGSVLRDYPTPLPLPKGRVEVGLDYLAGEAAGNDDQGDLGDMSGGRLLIDWGATRRTTLMADLAYGILEVGGEDTAVVSADLSLRRSLIQRRYGWIPSISGDVGLRVNQASEDVELTSGGTLALVDSRDATGYARLTAGRIWGRFFPNLFLEYGHSQIDGTLESTGAAGETIPSRDLSRSENYLKTGFSLLIKFPYRALLHLEYDYHRLFRGRELAQYKDDHLLKAGLNLYLTPSFSLNIGGRYAFHRQNGQIPFLYNEVTQNSFDRDFRQIQAGVTMLLF